MKEIFLSSLNPMIGLAVCILIGWLLRKSRILPEEAAPVISKLENYVLKPAVILKTFMTNFTTGSFAAGGRLFLASSACFAFTVLIAIPLSYLFERKEETRRLIYRYALIFANSSFIGYAIIPIIFDEATLMRFMLFCLPGEILCNSWGYMLLIPKESGGKTNSLTKRLFNPVFISLLVGALFGITGAGKYLPVAVTDTLSSLGACMSPLAMIMTGIVIAGYSLPKLLKNGKVWVYTALRLAVLPMITVGLLALFGPGKEILFHALFAFNMPVGLNTVIVPEAYDGDPGIGAAMTLLTDFFCVFTVPLLYVLVSVFL